MPRYVTNPRQAVSPAHAAQHSVPTADTAVPSTAPPVSSVSCIAGKKDVQAGGGAGGAGGGMGGGNVGGGITRK